MIRSMTGFGVAEGDVAGSRVTVEIRSVNHRFFNPTLKLPSQFTRWEGEVREALRKSVSRGHVTLFARVDRTADVAVVDEARFSAYVTQLRSLQQRHGLDASLDVATILRMPDVMASGTVEEEGSAADLVTIVERAAKALDEMRTAEGARLVSYLEQRLSIVEEAYKR